MDINNNKNLTRKERRELGRQNEKLENRHSGHRFNVKRVLIWLVVLIIIIGGGFGLIKIVQNSEPSASNNLLLAAISASDWYLGNKEAKTVLVEYSDFQCPACALFGPIVKEIISKNPDKLTFVYRNFPLPQHKEGLIASYAAEAAGKQGKFWEMHDILFQNQTEWSEKENARDIFINYAVSLGLNIDQFKIDIDSQDVKIKVENDYQSGTKSGVDSTPSFYLNGKKMPSPNSLDDFRNTIQQSIDTQ